MRPIVPSLLLLALAVAFSLPAGACLSAESENNDRDSRADGPVCSGVAIAGEISSRRDDDWFYLDTDAPTALSVVLDHGGGDDFDWAVYGESGPALATGATSSVPETGSVDLPSAGRWYVLIERYSGTGPWTLTLEWADGGSGGDCAVTERPRKPGGLRTWLTGSGDDACPPKSGASLLLMGGGPDVDEAFVSRAAPQVGAGDVVILRTSGSNGYNDYLDSLMAPDSVETLLVDRRSHADSDFVDWVVRHAEMVFLAGGDQSDYLNQWMGTRLQQALQHVVDSGGVVGGTSAGLAVLGEAIYDPDGLLGIYSDEAVSDPCHEYMNLSGAFLDLPWMGNTITDTHFAERDRMGRLLTFMARLGEPGFSPFLSPVRGIGVDEGTSLFVGPAGLGVVDGAGAVYVLTEDENTSRVQVTCGQPVIYEGVRRHRLTTGDTWDMGSDQGSSGSVTIGVDGRFSSFYDPSDPY